MTVQTVRGPIDPGDLGMTLVHEHIVAASAGILDAWPSLYGGRARLIETAVDALRAARELGVATIVDATTFDLGRDAALLAEVSGLSGVHIVAATGHWVDVSPTMAVRTVDQLTDLFVHELTRGIGDTDIRAGMIKIASDASIRPFEQRVLTAAVAASQATGAPILTHTAAAQRTGELQAAEFDRLGLDPSRAAIGHSDDSDDLGYLRGLFDRGYWVAFDRLPNGALEEYGGQTVDDRLRMTVRLVELGYGDRLLLGHDDPIWAGLLSDEDQARHRKGNPDLVSFLCRVAIPRLRELGLDDSEIGRLTVDNPRLWLTGQPA